MSIFNPPAPLTPEQKEQARAAAQEAVKKAEENLTNVKKSIETAIEQKKQAQTVIDAAKPAIMMAEASLKMAQATLLQFGPLPKPEGGSPVTFEQVIAVLRESPKQMTVAEIQAALAGHGVNASADNLKAYLARWAQTGSILKGEKSNRLEPARYYAPPTNGVAPLPPAAPSVFGGATAPIEGTPIASEFPASLVLAEAGITTMEAIPRDEESLRKIKGVGAATAKAILAALGA